MKSLIVFTIGVLVGAGACWLYTQHRPEPAIAQLRDKATGIGESLRDTFDPQEIKEELSRTGKVVRERAKQAGKVVSDATANARITATIKGKLLKESALAALKINVDTTDGVVELSGTVASHDQIARAMKIAMETDGVHKVVSTLQVQGN